MAKIKALPHKAKHDTKATQNIKLPDGFFQWKSCKQVMMFLSHTKADEKIGGYLFTFGYIESETNRGKRLSLTLNSFEQSIRLGTLVTISNFRTY